MLRRARDERTAEGPRRGGGRAASAGLLVAVGTGIGNVLAYGFNLVLSRGLGPGGYAELGTLLSVFLIGTVPGLAVQAINARRLAVVADASPAERAALVRGLRRRGAAVAAGVAAVFVALAPVVVVLLPSVTVGGVAWTGVSLAANTVFASYLGIAQGTSRFMTMTVLYLAAQGSRLAIGAVAASVQMSPTTVMAAQTAAWAFAAVAGRLLLREVADGTEAAGTQRQGQRQRQGGAVADSAPAAVSPTSAASALAAEMEMVAGPAAGKISDHAIDLAHSHTQATDLATARMDTAELAIARMETSDLATAHTHAADRVTARITDRATGHPDLSSIDQTGGDIAHHAPAQPEADAGAHAGYLTEVLRATGGLGGILLLTVLDTLLASRYLTGGDLGRYNTGALLARAAFFAPAFVAMLAYPRLARPSERRRALLVSLAVTGGIGVLGIAIAGIGGDPLIRLAFGAKYATPGGGFDLGAEGWVFTSVGALLALVNLALLDGVARRSHVVSAVVLGGIVLETTVIVGFAHGSAAAIVTAAAASALAIAAVSVTVCLMARTAEEAAAAETPVEDADPQAVEAVAQST